MRMMEGGLWRDGTAWVIEVLIGFGMARQGMLGECDRGVAVLTATAPIRA